MTAATAAPPKVGTDPNEPLRKAEFASASEVADFLTGLGSTGEVKFELFRKHPATHRGIKCDGHLRNYYEPFTIEQVATEHGGGKFQVRAQQRNATTGKWSYGGARTFDVAGVPNIELLRDPEDRNNGRNNNVPDPAVGQALNMAQGLVEDSREQARQAREDTGQRHGMDDGTKLMIEGVQRQLEAAETRNAEKDARIFELVSKAPDTSSQDKLYGIMEKNTSDHSSRITEIRIAHDSELRQLRDFHNQDLKSRENRFEKEVESVRRGHEREIDSLKGAHDTALSSQKLSYEMKVDTLKETIKRADRDLVKLEAEVGALRGKKDVSTMDQLETIVKLKNSMESVFPTASDDEPSKLQQILSTVAESPLVQSIASRIEGPGAPQLGPDGQPIPPGDRMIQVRDAQGQMHTLPESYVRRMQAQQVQQAAEDPNAPPEMDPGELKQAIAFLETAFGNGHKPEMVASTARNLIPQNILGHLKTVGIDEFLKNVGIADNSPLATIRGRVWIKQVAQVLLQGFVDPEPAPAAEPVEADVDFDLGAVVDDVDSTGGPAVD